MPDSDSPARLLDLALPEVSVPRRHEHIGMAQQAGDGRQRQVVHRRVAGARAAEAVRAAVRFNLAGQEPGTWGPAVPRGGGA